MRAIVIAVLHHRPFLEPRVPCARSVLEYRSTLRTTEPET
jgi:hypothetical protein